MPSTRDANWIDGLRGIASFMVVTGHINTAFSPWLHAPAMSDKDSPHILQFPYFRLAVGGRTAVALFFLITGYVNSIGPVGRARSGNVEGAFSGIARASLARAGRLVLPTAIATVIAWLCANLRIYQMAQHIDATWISKGWHAPSASVGEAITDLVHAQVSTWTRGWDEYDGTQWTLLHFLRASMLVYITLVATMLVQPRYRKGIYIFMHAYGWVSGDPLCMTNVMVGMLLGELHVQYGSEVTQLLPAPLPALLLVVGLFLAGFPQDSPDRVWWSRTMAEMMRPIVPRNSDLRRYWDHLAAALCTTAIFFSPRARRLLCSRVFNFLGRVSFPVYLLHNQLMRTLLVWLIYTPSYLNPPKDEHGNQKDLVRGGWPYFVIGIPIFYYCLYRIAYMWSLYVDPLCGAVIKWGMGKAYGEGGSQAEKPILVT